MSQSSTVLWAPFYGSDSWPERALSHIARPFDRGSKTMSEQPGSIGQEWRMPKWLPTVAISLVSAIFACGLFYGASLSKWDRFDDADRRLEARVLRLEEGQQAMRNDRAHEFNELKRRVGQIMARHVGKITDKLDETMRKVAVRTEATTRFESEMRRALERIRDKGPTP